MPKEVLTGSVREVEGSKIATGDTTIANGATAGIDLIGMTKAFSFLFNNDSFTSGYDVTLTINGSSTRKVKSGESLSISDFEITSLSLSNASGQTVSYRYMLVGE